MKTADTIIQSIVEETTVGLFKDNGLELKAVRKTSLRDPIFMCGVIGFTGAQARGSLLCATTFEPIHQVAQTGKASERDWLAELSNQLLGRVKTRLLKRGLEIHVSPPLVLRGEHLAPISQRQSLLPYQFECDAGSVFVWLDIDIDASVSIATEVNQALMAEGESLMF